MICPNCKTENVIIIYTDKFRCDCGNILTIDYCICTNCHYTFRLNNGKFLDAMEITKALLSEVANDLSNLFDNDFFDDKLYSNLDNDNMSGYLSDMINPCVKCGSVYTVFNDKYNEYECMTCGFRWEILRNE